MEIILSLLTIGLIAYTVKSFLKSSKEEINKQPASELSTDEILLTLDEQVRLIQAYIQAGIVGDTMTAGAIDSNTYRGPLPERRSDGGWLSIYDNLRILRIAGINHRSGIGRYLGRVECALVPEPENEYDQDAIKIVADDRHLLGYIPRGYTDLVCSFSANEFPYRCTAFIEENEDAENGNKYRGFVYVKRLD